MIPRIQERNIQDWLNKGKAIILIGPRQVGKTTLIRQITKMLERQTFTPLPDKTIA